jgi:hypothetical protein
MIALSRPALALALATAATLMTAPPVRAAQLCGWLTEKISGDSVHEFDLWLESDSRVNFFYKMTGKGVTTENSRSYSPGSGSFSLDPKRAEKAWGFGTTLGSEGDIDIVAEIHVMPKSVFDEGDTPLLASFAFKRHVPDGEKKPPADFAKRQCVTLATPG